MRYFMGRFVRLWIFGMLGLTVGCGTMDAGKPPEIPFVPLANQTPVPLQVATVEKFVDWVSTMPSSQVSDVKQQIALVKSDPKVVDAVASQLSFRDLGSYGRQLIYLSILGEMKNERALTPLQNYLHSRDCPVFEERALIHPVSNAPKTSIFDACAGLKAASINMIAYINSATAQTVVLQTINGHASRTVRLSAINAYLYNNGDSEKAMAMARQYAKPEEAKFVGIPRLSPDTNPKEFAARMARFYTEHPEELPPLPKQAARGNPGNGHPERVSVTPSAGKAGGAVQ
jgi:hypothetical protein